MDELGEPAFQKEVEKAKKQGIRSRAYIASLVSLGMFYNRKERYGDAQRVFVQALTVIDSGALKPQPKQPLKPPIVQQHGNGTVSATMCNPLDPYEQIMMDLLPGLVTAETELRKFGPAEAHVKRMINLSASNPVVGSTNLMSAYGLYATLLRKMGRTTEANAYQRKADEINASFKPL